MAVKMWPTHMFRLVDAIDYSTGDISQLTAAFIDEHSGAGKS